MAGFREFLARGNVLDLAVAVIIGAAIATLVASLTGDIIMPVIGAIIGDVDFSSYFIRLGPIPADYTGDPNNYAALKAAGVPMIGYGEFVTQLVNFLIVAWIIFLLVKAVNRVVVRKEAEAALVGPSELDLLTDIRDELRKRG